MIKKITAAILASIFIVGLMGTLTGCNTMAGAGKDIEKGGEKIQEKAN
ncbi:MAG TPA: entericidin A/B family lipoprotein [Flavobacterium sp.]|nr:entericidin A/B family lipoprotein [Flavobacterium sp.]